MSSMLLSKKTWYAIGVLALVLAVFLIGHRAGGQDIASAQIEYPEKAKMLGTWIDEQSAIWTEQDKVAADLQAQAIAAFNKRNDAETIAASHRKALCEEFGLERENGAFKTSTDCESAGKEGIPSFQ